MPHMDLLICLFAMKALASQDNASMLVSGLAGGLAVVSMLVSDLADAPVMH